MATTTRIQLRRGTAAEWASANPVLAVGEPGVELDTGKEKIGDGVTRWNARPYTAAKGDPGAPGAPGVNAVPTAEAVADYATTPGNPVNTALNSTVAGSMKSADTLARSQAMAFAAQPQPLSRWRTKLSADAANAKIVLMGDSTSDPIVEAVAILNRMKDYHTVAGRGLAGMTPANILSYGHNGTKLADWWTNNTWKAEITGSGAHLVILSYGINDFRLGATTQAAFRALLIQAVDYLCTQMATTDIVLRIPNSLTADNVHDFAAGWVMPATADAAQKYSSELRNAYLSLIDYWPDGVAVWDAQGRIFGVTAKPFASTDGLMKDILHPSAAKGYPAIADGLVEDLIGRNAVPARALKAAASTPVSGMLDMVGRSDNAASPGTASSGHVWNVLIGTFGVSAHQLYAPAGALARMVANVGFADGEFCVTLPVNDHGATLFFRYLDAGNYCYVTNQGGASYQVWKAVAGTLTQVANIAVTPAAGDRLRVRADKALVQVYINETIRGSYEIPDQVTGKNVGLQATTAVPRFADVSAKPF